LIYRRRVEGIKRFGRDQRGQFRAVASENLLGKPKLLEKAAQCGGAEPGCERKLKPARQPGILRHAGGDEREISRRGTLGRLHHI
jgi:hypothetical protein